jgi:hypothetical protein
MRHKCCWFVLSEPPLVCRRLRDLAIAVNLAERHVSRQLRLAYLAPEVLRRLTCGRETPAITLMVLTECAVLPWARQNKAVFDGALVLE